MVQPQSLQILNKPIKEPDVEPADLVDKAGVFLVDELDQGLDRDRRLRRLLAEHVDGLGQDRQAKDLAASP